MVFADICKPVYDACPRITSQEKYIDGLLGAAGGVSISTSYKKQLFKGEDNGKKKNLTIDLRRDLRGKNKRGEIATFFNNNIDDEKVQSLVAHYGIPEKGKADKVALCYALAEQLQALIDTDDEEAPDIIISMYQQAKTRNTSSNSELKGYGAKYSGDQIWVEEMGKSHSVNCYETFTHYWTIHNCGKILWQDRRLILLNQDQVSPRAHDVEIRVPDAKPNEIVKLCVEIDSRTVEGTFNLKWIMADKDNENCFEHDSSLDVSVTVSYSV